MRAAWANLAPAFANLRPDQVGRDACRRYAVGRQAQGRSAGTIIKELAMLRAALRWQDRASPAAIETPPAPAPRERVLTRAEYASLAEAARTVPHLATFVALALATAGRAGALLELKWGQVDFARGLVDLRDPARTARGAAAKGRAVVPMNAMLRTALEDARRSARTAFVVEYADRPVRSVKRAFAAACMRARLEGVTPHTLRHTAAVWMAQGGRLMPEIAQYLGHGDDRITQRVYARYSPDYLRAAARALEAG
jgi:integrase